MNDMKYPFYIVKEYFYSIDLTTVIGRGGRGGG